MFRNVMVFICVFLLAYSIVFSQSGKKKHDGFFMRFLAGPSYSTQAYDGAPDDVEVKGFSGSFNFQIGATIAENLIAYGEVGGFTITNPDVEINGETHETEDTKSSCFCFGGGITYYIMPANFYITGSIQAAQVKIEYTSGSTTYKGETDTGIGGFVGVGKEWWISDDWGLGATVFFSYSNVPDKGDSDVTVGSTTFGVAFSATFQ